MYARVLEEMRARSNGRIEWVESLGGAELLMLEDGTLLIARQVRKPPDQPVENQQENRRPAHLAR